MINFYLQYEYWFAANQLFFAMLGMGATLAPKDFHEVIAEPKAFSVGIGTQLLAVPLVAFFFIYFGSFAASLTIGIALIAAIPGGTISNIFAHLAKGNTPLSISITAITTIGCLLTTPFILDGLVAEYLPQNFSMPVGKIALEIGVYLLMPLVLGMGIFRYLPKHAEPFARWCVRLSLLIIVFIVLGSLGAGRLNLALFGSENILILVCFFFVLAAVGHLIPRLFSLNQADRVAIEMEVVVRNVNLGLLVNASLFPATSTELAATGNIVLLALLLFGSMQLILGVILITINRRKANRSA